MRLGVVGLMPRDCRDVTARHVQRIRELGLTGVSCVLPSVDDCTQEQMEHVRSVLNNGGVSVAQVNAQYAGLISPDETARARGIVSLQHTCRCGTWLHAASVYVRPGSLNTAGHWTPHPRNTDPATLTRLVNSLKQVCQVAEDEGAVLALEGHVVSSLDTPARVREVIDAVGSPSLTFNLDPVNFVPSIPVAFDNRPLLDEMFDTLGDRIRVAHAKDLRVEDRLVVHIAECAPGEGLLDMEYCLQRFERVAPNGWMLIEHLPDDRVPAAAAVMRAAAERAGVPIRT